MENTGSREEVRAVSELYESLKRAAESGNSNRFNFNACLNSNLSEKEYTTEARRLENEGYISIERCGIEYSLDVKMFSIVGYILK